MTHFYASVNTPGYSPGDPVYEVPMSTKEGFRSTTIRDARKLNLAVGVTSVIDVLDKIGMLKYHQTNIVKAVLDPKNAQKEGEPFEKWMFRLIEAAKDDTVRNKGSYYHDCLEQYYKGRPLDGLDGFTAKDRSFIEPVIEAVCAIDVDHFGLDKGYVFHPEISFAHVLGFGGKVDLVGKVEVPDRGVIIDFKGKKADVVDKFELYDSYLMQLSAYRYGLGMINARCYNIFFSVNTPNIIKVHEWSDEELKRGWEQFKCLLEYWQLVNNHNLRKFY